MKFSTAVFFLAFLAANAFADKPNIDQLAARGVRFTQHYTGAPVCAPARCTLMTGKNLAHAEIRSNMVADNTRVLPGDRPITEEALTIAEIIKEKGCTTGAYGKSGGAWSGDNFEFSDQAGL